MYCTYSAPGRDTFFVVAAALSWLVAGMPNVARAGREHDGKNRPVEGLHACTEYHSNVIPSIEVTYNTVPTCEVAEHDPNVTASFDINRTVTGTHLDEGSRGRGQVFVG
jgi:hypothetical protein